MVFVSTNWEVNQLINCIPNDRKLFIFKADSPNISTIQVKQNEFVIYPFVRLLSLFFVRRVVSFTT